MKINRLDAHDRYEYFKKQDFDIGACCQDLIDRRPFGDHPFYIFAHTRTEEDGATKRLIWQPRLTKPKAQTNSMLFKAYPGTDVVKVIWMIPAPELWDQFTKGKMTQNKTVCESIELFKSDKNRLEEKEDDDLTEKQVDAVYREISANAQAEKRKKNQNSSLQIP